MSHPLPRPTPETAPYWDAVARRELHIPRCKTCMRPHFYPRPSCPFCYSSDLVWEKTSGKATLLSYIINRRPLSALTNGGAQIIAIVELEEGVRMTTNIVDVEPSPTDIALDMALELDFREVDSQLLPVFAPAGGRQ